ncbi:MAG: ATP-binding protein [Puniceicoccales bacterium]|jgi:predicted AAA+ superfamily ATPase|nr:ATP-binding protein [Puniceicoccales bacterium]
MNAPNSFQDRWLSAGLAGQLATPYVHILFGARQTGKSTLLKHLLPADTFFVNLADPAERNRHLADAGLFAMQCRALPRGETPATVFVDEAQTVPSVFDSVQALYDEDKTRWRFVLCGSSARKLRRSGANLLPGRALLHHLEPLTLAEQPSPHEMLHFSLSPLPFTWDGTGTGGTAGATGGGGRNLFPQWDIGERLAFGALPGIVNADEDNRAALLETYTSVFLEEEIRREGLVKDIGSFLRFLQLAANEAGGLVNFASISREAGISVPTVKSHYQLLEDMFVGFSVPALTGSARKRLLSTPRFFFFDLGVRNAAAGLAPSIDTARAQAGALFEQWVGIELWKRLRYLRGGRLHYWRTADGAEIDFVIERQGKWTPVEVKWTENPSTGDARHLAAFLRDNSGKAERGWIVSRCSAPLALADNITAIPWWML